MEFSTQSTSAFHQVKTTALAVGVFADGELSAAADVVNRAAGGALKSVIGHDFLGHVGETLVLHNVAGVRAERIVLVGLGKQASYGIKAFQKAQNAFAKQCVALRLTQATSALATVPCPDSNARLLARLSAQAASNAAYYYDATMGKPDPKLRPKLKKFDLLANRADLKLVQTGLTEGAALGEGMALTRTLGNLPGNICTPTYLGNQAKALGRQFKSIKVSVLEKKQIEALGMGSFLSVAKGSNEPPRFIVMHYKGKAAPKAKSKGPIVLVGKGITFDTGGISIKPAATMDEMKFDMCGAASVFGTMLAIAKLQWPGELVGLIPTCENMPSGTATKPGDVVKSMSGQTIEVLNTDAEGRLILCDALTYAERYKPSTVIDIATLTGACIVALGTVNSGLFSPDDELAEQLLAAGKRALDPAWRLPVEDEYQDFLKSNFADMANIGNAGPKAGAVTAACFLARFAKAYRWAHLDIAGTSWLSGAQKGASGRPVPLLLEYLLEQTGQ
ncbi:MAG: leucyl aminopeptidase [Burkholderiaceae bacterium]|nr:leucyl aminopeptidase [Burkholderiaceae bacterium]